MPVYTYTARDQSGNTTNGTVEAISDSLAAAHLRDQGLWVTELRAAGGARAGGVERRPATVPGQERGLSKQILSPVSLKDQSLFYRQLYTLLNSGVALYQAFEMLSNPGQTPNAQLRRVVGELARDILAGRRLSEGMERYPWLFDKMQRRMVEAGEAGGLLVEIIKRLADYLEREYEIRQHLKRQTLYPMLVLLMLILVLPINMPLTLGGYLRDLTQLVLFIGVGGVVLWLVARVFLASRGGREFYDQVKLALPIIGKLIRKLAAARFARCLAALYGAGVPIASALALAGESSGNHALELQSQRMVPAVERGMSVAQVLTASNFFPPMFTGMVSTGESTGNLDTMLDKAADFYEEEAAHATTQLMVILGVVLLVGVGICVLFKVLSFYTGMFRGIFNAAGEGGNGGAGGE
jgi:type IV pilus assembly protein PilC